MDRLPRKFVACGLGLGLLLVAPGCKLTRPEVPPGRPYANDGRQRKAIEFSSEGHPVNGAATTNLQPNNNVGGSNLATGIGAGVGRPDPSAYGAPAGSFGPPGTSGLGQPPSLDEPRAADPSAMPAAMDPPAASRTSAPAAGAAAAPTMPDLNIPPPREAAPAPNQVIQAPMDMPGSMGRPDQMPSPN